MIKKNNEVREFVLDEVANQFRGYVIFEDDLEQIATEVQESAESKFSVDVDFETVLQIVRLFYLAQPFLFDIQWHSATFDQLEIDFHEHFPSTDPLQVKRLCSDQRIGKKVRRIILDYSISWIKFICESLQDADDNDIPTSGHLLDQMSGEIEYIREVFISPSEPTSKAT